MNPLEPACLLAVAFVGGFLGQILALIVDEYLFGPPPKIDPPRDPKTGRFIKKDVP